MTEYGLKYPKVDPDVMKHTIIPQASDYCARERARLLWTPKQYRQCLSAQIKKLIREQAGE